MGPASESASPAFDIVVDGCGLVGLATVRQLVGAPEVGRVGVATATPARVDLAADILGPSVVPSHQIDRPTVAVVAGVAGSHEERARAWLEAGAHVVSVSSDPDDIEALEGLGQLAAAAGRTVVVGAAASPGITSILARHAAGWFDEVREIRIASFGAAGANCARTVQRCLQSESAEWRDGRWHDRAPTSGRELCWFPDPIGGRDCYAVDSREPQLLHRLLPGVDRISCRAARPDAPWIRRFAPVGRQWNVDPIGAVRVEVRGRRSGRAETIVYGMVDRPSVSTAACSMVAAVWAASGRLPAGTLGLATPEPVPLLARLAAVGVRAAVFEGSESDGSSGESA